MASTTSAVYCDSIVFANSSITWFHFESFVELESDVLQNIDGKDSTKIQPLIALFHSFEGSTT
jgi:hypothetical protein